MPLTFLSHQALVLPLKLAAPRRVSGTALVLGSMAPDAVYFARGMPVGGELSHSWTGQLTVCLPVTLVLFWVVTRIIARPLAANLPAGGAFRLREYELLHLQPRTLRHWTVVALSALVGSVSHMLLDRYTGGWSAEDHPSRFAALTRELLPGVPWAGVQILLWLVLAIPAVIMLAHIGRRGLLWKWALGRAPGAARPRRMARRPLLFWSPIAVTAIVAIVWGATFRRRDYHLHDASTWVQVGLRTTSCVFLAMLIMSLWWWLRLERESFSAEYRS